MSYPFEGSSEEPTYPTATDIEPEADVETDAVDDQPEDEDGEPRTTSRKSARRKTPRSGVRLTAAQVRRVLSQADVIEQLETSERDLLAATLGTNGSTEDLVVATLSATKAGDVITELLAIAAEEDQFQPVMLAHTLLSERDNARRVWALLTALDKVSGGIPAKEIQAATVVAAAAKNLSATDLVALDAVTEILS